MNNVPEEIIAEVFSFLHSKFIILISSLVCKKWLSVRRLTTLQLKIGKQQFSKFCVLFDKIHHYFAIKKLSASGWKITDSDIEKLCSFLNEKTLEHLSFEGQEVSSTGLKLIVEKFSKLKSLDVRGHKYGYQHLVDSKNELPNLVNLKVDLSFNDTLEQKELSIKPQIRSLTIHNDRYSHFGPLANLAFENLVSLKLEGNITIKATALPLNLRKLSITNCFVYMKGIERVSEKLECLELRDVEMYGFDFFEECTLTYLKSLTLQSMGRIFLENVCNSNKLKPLNLTHLDISHNQNGSMMSKLCKSESLISLNISYCNVDTNNFTELMSIFKWETLSRLDASFNALTADIIPVLERIPSLKFLNLKNNQMNNIDRGILYNFGSRKNIEIDCSSNTKIEFEKVEETHPKCLESPLTIHARKNFSKMDTSVCSFDFNKNLKVYINYIKGITDFHTNFKPRHTLSFIIECQISCKQEKKHSKVIPYSDFLEWNEEIIFKKSNISELLCDSKIEFVLFCLILDPITGITDRKYISKIECPAFDSNLELQQGDIQLFSKIDSTEGIEPPFSMSVTFETYDYPVKYESPP